MNCAVDRSSDTNHLVLLSDGPEPATSLQRSIDMSGAEIGLEREGEEEAGDQQPLVAKEAEDAGATPAPPGARSRFYTLPRTRYRNIAELILITDAIVSLALWLTGA